EKPSARIICRRAGATPAKPSARHNANTKATGRPRGSPRVSGGRLSELRSPREPSVPPTGQIDGEPRKRKCSSICQVADVPDVVGLEQAGPGEPDRWPVGRLDQIESLSERAIEAGGSAV